MKFFTLEKIAKQLPEVRALIHREVHPLTRFKYHVGDVAGAEQPAYDDHAWDDFEVGLNGFWGGYDVVAWFRARVPIPDHLRDKKLALRFLVGPRDGGDSTAETMLYVNGEPLQGIDVWHEEAWLPPETYASGAAFIALRAWSGVLGVPPRRNFRVAQLLWIDPATEDLYYLADTLLKAVKVLDPADLRRARLLEALNDAFVQLDFTRPGSEAYYASAAAARDRLAKRVAEWQALDEMKPSLTAIGHAHIDLAWLWRLQHSREKAARTFATVLHFMRQYPEYRFMHSSPQLYKFLKEDQPGLFQRIKDEIAAGHWEITGGMWVESDTNLPSGESLVRQFLHGRAFIRREFGLETSVLWLPDVFGYSWALPQIARKSGMRCFMTTKISWSQFNRFPYDTFFWRGLDGTELLTHFVTTPDPAAPFYTYNGRLEPADVYGIWEQYRQKDINDELLHLFGWGDGGGGPTKEMLESARALKNLPGLPRVSQGASEAFFERLAARVAGRDVPTWDGELYLEYHRGTYTSQAAIKRANRKAEVLFHTAEWLCALADVALGESEYPAASLREGWERILLNQFHDILPGSSIHAVYEDAREDYAIVRGIGELAASRARRALTDAITAEQPSVVVFNPLGWPRSGVLELPWTAELDGQALAGPDATLYSQVVGDGDKRRVLLEVPPVPSLGYQVFPLAPAPAAPEAGDELVVTPEVLENAFYRVQLNAHGQITSLFDKRHHREVLAPGARANVFQAFEDKPMAFDAWDIDLYYQEKLVEVDDLLEAVVEEAGPVRGVLRLAWRYHDSVITQRLTLYRTSPRLDFRTEVDWHQQQVLLKVAFPVAVRATRATYDIQFGCLERPTHWNTSWDWARFEVVAHKWVDLSEGNYGVALLNDCKYGHDVKDNVLRLTLIKSPIRPDPHADQGRHEFTYSLLPHAGDWRVGGVKAEGYDLNVPLLGSIVPAQPQGRLPAAFSFAACDAPNAVIETIKQAEDGQSWVVRVYEAQQFRSAGVRLSFGRPVRAAVECNLVEEDDRPVAFDAGGLTFDLTPFEIKTFKVWFA